MAKKESGRPGKPVTIDSILKCSSHKLKQTDMDSVRAIDEDAQTDLLELTLPEGKVIHLQAKNAWVNPVHDTFAGKVKKAKSKGGLGLRK